VTNWLPRNPHEALIKTDTILAGIVPQITRARARIIDTIPGHSGRPAGNGEPGGGKGASTSSVVERCAAKNTAEMRTLTRLDELVDRVYVQAWMLTPPAWPIQTPPPGASHARQLALTRWLIRQLIRAHIKHKKGDVDSLWRDVCDLDAIVGTWAEPRHGGKRTLELAVDPTEQWCRSCLRAGHRNQRDDRYARHGLCRWCGDFRAEQGQLPTLDIIDAHETGSPIAVARLIRDSKPRKKRRK
jgi:hypothetical protein